MARISDAGRVPTKAKKPATSVTPVSSGGGGSFRPISIPQGAISAPAPVVPRPASAPTSGGTTQNLGSSATGAIGAMPPAMTDEQFLAQDPEFIDTNASLGSEFDNLKAQLARERGDYTLDINNSKRNMGWQDQGGWNAKDKLTSYGNAFNNQQNDFASRGMLDSSLYGGALNDLNRGFDTQRSDLEQALSQFTSGQDEQLSQASGAKNAAVVAARRQALERMAASLGLGG